VVRAIPIARQRVAKHTPAKANAWNNRTSIARQGRGKEALSTKQTVFSVASAKSVIRDSSSEAGSSVELRVSAVEC
jgi:hypothetical protein